MGIITKENNYLLNFNAKYVDNHDIKDWDDYDKVINENYDLLEKINTRCKANNRLTGRYFTTPVGDGEAYYQVVKVNRKTARVVRCIGLGDDYRDLRFMDEALIDINYVRCAVDETEEEKKYRFCF